MNDTDNNNNTKSSISKIWDTVSFCLTIIGFLFGVLCLFAGIHSLINKESFTDSLVDTLKVVFQEFLVGPLVLIAILVIWTLFKLLFEEHPVICLILIAVIVIALPAGSRAVKHSSNSLGNRFNQKIVQTHWNYFEKISRLGDDYRDIYDDYGPWSDEFLMNGGIQVKGSDGLYYAFPRFSESEILETDQCTGMAGTIEELFGYKDSITVDGFTRDLGLTSETEFEGNLLYKKTAPSGYYYVTIMSVDITKGTDSVKTDTWVSIIQRNRAIIPIGSLASDQNPIKETVFFVQDGNRYHSDPTCSTLHDSDEIYECYSDEVPDGR